MFHAPRVAGLACCAASAALIAGCAPHSRDQKTPGTPRAPHTSFVRTVAPNELGVASVPSADRDALGDFCGWYNDDLPQIMDTVSVFLAAFGVSGGDYSDPRVDGSAQDADQAAGDAAGALNDFLAGFPDDLSDAARRAVLGLRDAMAALASAIRDQRGSEEINAEVALFDEAHKALRAVCSA